MATLRATADASATAADDFNDSQTPPTADSGLLPITTLPATATATLGASAHARYAQANANSSGAALVGAPGSFAGAVLSAQGSAWAFTPGGGSNPQTAGAISRSEITYDDVLTAGGLPPGSPIALRVTLQLSCQINHMGSQRAASASLRFGDPPPASPVVELDDADQNGEFAQSTPVTVVVVSGTPRPIELKLIQQATANASIPGDGLGSAGIDVAFSPHRGRLYIDVLTPGATYVLQSGADLRSPSGTSAAVLAEGSGLALAAPRPNPARGAVTVELAIPSGGAQGRWRVIDLAGRALWCSGEQRWSAGRTLLQWSGADSQGHPAPGGVYFLRVDTDQGHLTRRIVRIP